MARIINRSQALVAYDRVMDECPRLSDGGFYSVDDFAKLDEVRYGGLMGCLTTVNVIEILGIPEDLSVLRRADLEFILEDEKSRKGRANKTYNNSNRDGIPSNLSLNVRSSNPSQKSIRSYGGCHGEH
ncbi:hypothetical protein CMI42_05605 [Candidatus Pacearchaeota archaeon]|nr:hypothetical protein [Candidatus Pacearchaeota archaeon]|tara:strand:+ start:1800 stop:2183 length:384 start_codon:yes stop_codon:yes gene_type:complete